MQEEAIKKFHSFVLVWLALASHHGLGFHISSFCQLYAVGNSRIVGPIGVNEN